MLHMQTTHFMDGLQLASKLVIHIVLINWMLPVVKKIKKKTKVSDLLLFCDK